MAKKWHNKTLNYVRIVWHIEITLYLFDSSKLKSKYIALYYNF